MKDSITDIVSDTDFEKSEYDIYLIERQPTPYKTEVTYHEK